MPSAPRSRSPLIDLRGNLRSPVKRGLYTLVGHPFEALAGIKRLNKAYAENFGEFDWEGRNLFCEVLSRLNVSYELTGEDYAKLPREGPVLVVSNHPFGGLDGMVLGAILTSVRADAKLLANYLLANVPGIDPWLIAVDPFGAKGSAKRNVRAIQETIRFLRGGGMVGTFPAGTVSHVHLRQRQIVDPAWQPNTGRFVRLSRATVVPVYFEGNNSKLFQLAGLVHPTLRTMLLPRELMNKADRMITVRVGNPISYQRLASFESDAKLTEFLRVKTYVLRERGDEPEKPKHRFLPRKRREKTRQPVVLQPLIVPVPVALLEREVAALPEEAALVSHAPFTVYHARANQIPNILRELGRLREKTFREVDEGTGEPMDSDRFDRHYHHLFLWDSEQRRIAGAYRFGLTDEILAEHGKDGLYTRTLFKFKQGFLEQIDPSMELGRSFIVSEYQRKHATLTLLWRAICVFLVRNPRYEKLFGPVSITRQYNALSRDLIVQFMKQSVQSSTLSPLRPLVKAKNPPKGRHIKGRERAALLSSARDIDDVSAIISEIERDKKGVPTLLKHYMKLSGQVLSFNVDNDFGQCLDGLIVVDMPSADPRLLRVYFGSEGVKTYLDYHYKRRARQTQEAVPQENGK